MIRVAIYARFSSDNQNARSIPDQVALCRDYAQRQGWIVAEVFSDEEKSATTVHGRFGFQAMQAAARDGRFDIMLAEDMDRLTRDQADTVLLHKRMQFIGIEIHTVLEGRVTKLSAGIAGLKNSFFIDNMVLHIRRGQAGRVREGRSPGGLAYGYAVVVEHTAGERHQKRGLRAIVEEQAIVVRRIFAEYLAGRRPREIVADLNKEGIKPPRGRYWTPSTLLGNPKRGYGILLNAIYDGKLVWNRVRNVANPDSEKHLTRANPKSDWMITEVPELRIVDAETFAAAQKLRTERGRVMPAMRRKPRHLLSGLLKCGCCGGGLAIKDTDRKGRRVQCSRMKETGACQNRTAFYLDDIERRTVAGLKQVLLDPRAIERFITTYHAERKRLAGAEAGRRRQIEKRLREVDRELARATDSLMRGLVPADAIGPEITARHEERTRLESELAAMPYNRVIALHPKAIEHYLEAVNNLAETLSRRVVVGDEAIALALRKLIEAVTITARPGQPPVIDVRGRLIEIAGHDPFASGGLTVPQERARQSPGPVFAFRAA